MKLDAIAQNPLEWLALKSRLVPTPLGHSHIAFILSRAVLEATDTGIFEALEDAPLSLQELARQLELNEMALQSLLNVLASAGYVAYKKEQWQLTRLSRKWMLRSSPDSVAAMMILDNRVCWHWMNHLGDFLKTGKGLGFHTILKEQEWSYYQDAMASAARAQSREVGKRVPVPRGASQMLDIGGSHGLHSVALCRKQKALQATIMDLPEAIRWAKPILEQEGMGDQVQHKAGNILEDSLPEQQYDLVLMSSLSHHFSKAQNTLIAEKIFKALRPGGYYVLMDFVRPEPKTNSDLIGSSSDLFFALSSTAGTYTIREMKRWQKDAGLQHHKLIRFFTIPNCVAVIGKKAQ
ncbi:class I SAM-dependent methyltransferase [Cesiribacter sp. SM1]|uniref:class I SAM-dependent methyltransferase n=1 Tax=Cesiribacter sp. SM1 TaxID=2861196 RepID=UPI001CD7D5FA|nr:class I SAM-dependent methyltransferase [Cesiribacter sp. SM1]